MAGSDFQQLARAPALRKFYGLVHRLFKVNVGIGDPECAATHVIAPKTAWNPFCLRLQLIPGFTRRCLECDRVHVELLRRRKRAFRYRCHAGMTEFLIPIMLQGKMVAFLHAGQVLDRPASAAAWRRSKMALALSSKNAQRLKSAYDATPVIAPEAQTSLMELLDLFANYFARTHGQLLLLEQPWNSQVVARAQRFIREHLPERISLEQVARAACTSKRNLSRIFQRELHSTVLGFIHDCRIKAACELLRGGQHSSAAIAHRCGFGSVQQFNRVFLAHTGRPPQLWRRGVKGRSVSGRK